jgi:hypothetical protein
MAIFQAALGHTLRYEQIFWITIMHLSSIFNSNLWMLKHAIKNEHTPVQHQRLLEPL